uniref:bidirectional sugar transporter N3-like n=1 Tax=Erigeron canadensis TaxID=72917 RepID=UPI001CB8F631|nr:bidirectional sugar transporter N3-like [Erigeron canadensis]
MAAGNSATLTFAVGLVGNVISLLVFLSPLPTFYKVYKKKSTSGFQATPYIVGLFSAMLWIYYALLKTNAMLLITINSVGCFIQSFYICIFLFYAPKKARMRCLIVFVSLIIVGFGLIVVLTYFLAHGATRGVVVGWICLVFSLCVFLAPLGVLKIVIQSKSVEFMPILLTVALTVNAVVWFGYGYLLRDINIAIPNILGFLFGVVQMILYFVFKYKKRSATHKMTDNLEEGSDEGEKIPEEEVKKEVKVIGIAMGVLICAEIPTLNRSKSSLPVSSKLDKSVSLMPVRGATLSKNKSMIPVAKANLNKSKTMISMPATLNDRDIHGDLPADSNHHSVAISPPSESPQTIETATTQ